MLSSASPSVLALYGLVAVIAGFIDTLAGGGGLLTVPALLLGGFSPLQTLGTNKLQGVFGTFVATASLFRRSEVTALSAVLPFSMSLIGGAIGAVAVQQVNARSLDLAVPIVLVAIALYFLLAPKAGSVERKPRLHERGYSLFVLPSIGFYDGFFGPGTGSFYALTGVSLRGWDLVRATANAKLFNLASSLASLIIFIRGGRVMWLIGLAMICGQVVGARFGSTVVMKGGAKVIRPMIVVVCVVMLGRYMFQKGLF